LRFAVCGARLSPKNLPQTANRKPQTANRKPQTANREPRTGSV